MEGFIGTIAVAIAGFIVYFIPTIAAERRRHRNRKAILMLNLLAGWTAIGWLVAIVWAFTDNTEMVTAKPTTRMVSVPGAKDLY